MAPFNPNIPTNVPPPESYLMATRALSHWDAPRDNTVASAISGVGNVLGTAIKGADEVMKLNIDTGLRQDLTGERDTQTQALEQIAGLPQDLRNYPAIDAGTSGGSSNGGPQLIPGATAAPMPAELQSVDRTVSGPATGALTKPAMSTYYTGKLDMIAKDYRARYPGYADYIDQRVAAITGGNPANQRIADLMEMVKATQGNAQQALKEATTFVASHDKYPGSDKVIADIRSGNTGGLDPMTYAVKWSAPYANADYQTQSQIQQNAKFQGDQAVLKDKNLQSATDMALSISHAVFGQAVGAIGTPKDLQDKATAYRTGAIPKPDSATLDSYGQAAEAAGMIAWSQVKQRLDTPGPDGRSQSSILGAAAVDQLKQQTLEPFITVSKQFRDQNVGLAFDSARYVTLTGSDTNKWLLDKSPASDFFRLQKAVASNGGQAAVGMLSTALVGGKYGSMDDVLKGYGDYRTTQAAAEPGHPLADTLTDMTNRKVGVGPGREAQRDLYKYFTTDLPAQISNSKLDSTSRSNLASNLFAGNSVDQFDADSKHNVLQSMTKPEISSAVWQLGGSTATSPLWMQYKNWVSNNTRVLLKDDVHSLQELETKGNADFTWDPKTFSVKGTGTEDQSFVHLWDTPTNVIRKGEVSTLPTTLAKINTGLQPYVDIAKKEGVDPSLFIANQLNNLGIDPTSKLMQSITGQAQAEPAKVVNKSSPDTPVSDFLLNLPDHVKNFLSPYIDSASQAAQKLVTPDHVKGSANAAVPNEVWGNPMSPDFKTNHLTQIESPTGKPVQVNKVAADAFKGFLGDLAASGYKIDDVQGYNLREKRNGDAKGISQHAFGNAIDINPDINKPRSKGNLPPNISDIAAKWGISWGGDWSDKYKDPMHFEYTGRSRTASK